MSTTSNANAENTTIAAAAAEEDFSCKVCKKSTEEELLILCDGCDGPYHTFCAKGCTCCGQKPKGVFKRNCPVPAGDWFCKFCINRIPKTTKLLLPSCSKTGNYSVPLSSVFAWGDNSCRQLGIEESSECIKSPVAVTDLSTIPVSIISCGSEFTVVGTTEGEIYSVGNGCNGQLGHLDVVHEIIPHFRRIEAFDRENVSKGEGDIDRIVCGSNFTIALTSDGQAYSFGCGSIGQLGHQDNNDKKAPKKISALRQMDICVNLLACGNDFSLMTTRDSVDPNDQFNTDKPGVFMSMGSNGHGQLGDSSGRNQWVPQRLNKEGDETTTKPDFEDFESNESFPLGRDIKEVSAGVAHSVALTQQGGVWTWGYGNYGQLAHNIPPPPVGRNSFFRPQFRVLVPRFVWSLREEIISSVVCGANHTFAQSSTSGKFWSWGSNKYGQLGVGKDEKELELSDTPLVVEAFDQMSIKSFAAGADHSLALTSDGQVFSWGRNHMGQLGLGEASSTVNVTTPTIVPGLPSIQSVSCGSHFSFAIEFPGKSSGAKKRGTTAESSLKNPKKKSKKKN